MWDCSHWYSELFCDSSQPALVILMFTVSISFLVTWARLIQGKYLRVSSLRVVLDTSHQALGLVPVWCSSLNQRHVGHLKRRDDMNRFPHFLNYKHQFLPHHTTGSTELKCLISEMSVMHTLGAIPGTGANPGCGVQWWAWSYAGCRLDSRLQLSYWFALWSFKYPRTLNVLKAHLFWCWSVTVAKNVQV